MKVSLNWLKDYVDIEMPPDELGQALTMTGLEVEGIETTGQSLEDIVVAKILAIEPHPGADRLAICHVDNGQSKVQVVCGAPNLEVGAAVPLAMPGARLPTGTVIKEGRIRGEISKGMLLAEDEMCLTDDHSGIMVLPSDCTPGTPLASALALSDWILDVSITPNRPDCASVIGIAREIAAITGKRLKRPEIVIEEKGPSIQDLSSVAIMDPEGCPRYTAGLVQGIELRPSPFWMRYRLYVSGVRAINNIVDVTNYVMLEMGQPLHAFDYHRLRENRIVVRRAQEGERFTTLDGQSHTLNSDALMICDAERAVALAGIMGGLNSEIFSGTTDVLVESAFFDPVTIRKGSKQLGVSTEASYRFERGADIGGTSNALKRAISLISSLAGGRVAIGLIDNYPKAHIPPVIDLRVDKTNKVLGTALEGNAIEGHLRALEMEVQEVNANEFRVTPPSFRVDITRDVDLIEEVARLYGYDKIPVTSPRIKRSEEGEAPELGFRDKVRSVMVGLGFTEVITYSFISPESADILGAEDKSALRAFVKLLNPLSIDQSVMRTSLIPGLLATVKNNILHGEKGLRLFEWGKTFIVRDGDQLPSERNCVAGVMSGLYQEKTWYADEQGVNFYDIKGAVETLLKGMGLQGFAFQKGTDLPFYDQALSSSIYCGDSLVGVLGRVSSRVMQAYDLTKQNVYLFELDVQALFEQVRSPRKFQPIPKFPAVYRDISLIVNREIESGKIVEIIKREQGELVESVHIFDVYEGEKINPGEKALAFSICYRSSRKTLDGGEVNEMHEAIIEKIREETGGRLREG